MPTPSDTSLDISFAVTTSTSCDRAIRSPKLCALLIQTDTGHLIDSLPRHSVSSSGTSIGLGKSGLVDSSDILNHKDLLFSFAQR